MHTTPVSLLERLREPAPQEAWERFVNLYTPLLYYWARRVGCQVNDAADLVQDVLIILVQKLPEFDYDPSKSFRSWLRTITLNRWRAQQRRAANLPLEAAGEVTVPPDSLALEAFEETHYRCQLVKQAFAALRKEIPSVTWQAFEGYVIAGRDAKVVAAELGIAVGTVYAAKSRVLTRLRQELAGILE